MKICSDNKVWECGPGSDDEIAENERITAECDSDTDCLMEAEFVMVEGTLAEDCAAAGQVCPEDIMEGPAECVDP